MTVQNKNITTALKKLPDRRREITVDFVYGGKFCSNLLDILIHNVLLINLVTFGIAPVKESERTRRQNCCCVLERVSG